VQYFLRGLCLSGIVSAKGLRRGKESVQSVAIMSFNRLSSGHSSYLHDLAYDYYGHRLATCSSDQKIKIWDYNNNSNEWKLTGEINKAHTGSITKITW
jgi:WD40 repeat protein